ncbi:Uncharacterised protein [Moraxella caprae]|uniref:STAS domain-containing protein n=1 Tax=Moraxella caprae TaxID=90240 RepID=A0A378R329_9GAMM|nr:STAS domain-containing protein [Moraxella caprae]STZ09662.1 Uncharacterised protein [Moraxella caprae]
MNVQKLPTESTDDLAYEVTGQVFFASADNFIAQFDFSTQPKTVSIDLTHAHFGDITAISSLDKVVLKYLKWGQM